MKKDLSCNHLFPHMLRLLARYQPVTQFTVLRQYSQGAFDIGKILASAGASSETARPRHNRFSNKYTDKSSAKNLPSNRRTSFGDAWRQQNIQNGNQTPKASWRNNDQPNKDFTFNIQTGSEKAQEALRDVIVKTKQYSPSFYVRFLDPKTNKLCNRHLLRIVNLLDLTTNGLLLVPPKEKNELPLIRINKLMEMLQSYSDQLAAQKEAELMELGSERFMRKVQIRHQAEKKKSATKILMLSWSISSSDLMNQKKTEIVKRLKKDEKFQICVDDKKYNIESLEEPEEDVAPRLNRLNQEDFEFEMNKRQLLFDKLQQILEDCDCKTEVKGSLEGRIMVKVTARHPIMKKNEESTPSKEKDRKRMKKAQKARELADKKAAASEDDLDALYLFKIED